MQLFFVSYLVPATTPATEAARVNSAVDSLLHALRPPSSTPEVGIDAPVLGTVVQLSQDPTWLRDQLLAVSKELRLLIMPRDRTKPCVAHPASLLARLKLDRDDWDVACMQFSEVAGR